MKLLHWFSSPLRRLERIRNIDQAMAFLLPASLDSMPALMFAVKYHGSFGLPELTHPLRVAFRAIARFGWDRDLVSVCLLHGVLDTFPRLSADDLRAAGINDRVVAGVVAITKLPLETDDDYLKSVSCNTLATKCMMMDIQDNNTRPGASREEDEVIERAMRLMTLAKLRRKRLW